MAIHQQRAFSFLRDLLESRSQEEIKRRLGTPTIFSLARGSESAKCGDPIHALVSEVSSAYAQREPVWALQRGLKLCALKPRCLFALETSIMRG